MNFYRTRPRRRPTHERVLAVEGGEVMCPRSGIVDIEDCWICPAYRGFSGGSVQGLVCSNDIRLTPVVLRSATA